MQACVHLIATYLLRENDLSLDYNKCWIGVGVKGDGMAVLIGAEDAEGFAVNMADVARSF